MFTPSMWRYPSTIAPTIGVMKFYAYHNPVSLSYAQYEKRFIKSKTLYLYNQYSHTLRYLDTQSVCPVPKCIQNLHRLWIMHFVLYQIDYALGQQPLPGGKFLFDRPPP